MFSATILKMMGQMASSMPSTVAASRSASASNWVTLDDLRAKGLRSSWEMDPGIGMYKPYVSGSGTVQEKQLYAALIQEAFPILHSYGIQPKTFEVSAGDNTWTESVYTEKQIFDLMKEKGFSIGADQSRQVGNPASSGSWSLPIVLLDKNKNPVTEWTISNSNWGGFLRDFASKFGSIILSANAAASLLAPGSVAAAGGVNTAVIGETIAAGAPAAVQSAVTNAVVSGSMTALSGGDAEDVIKNALIGGATGAVGELVKPYVQDAIDFVKDLSPEGLENVVAAAEGAEDVAGGAVTDVDVGGVGDVGAPAGVEQMSSVANFSPEAMQTYANEIAAGASRDLAYARAALVENQLQAAQSIYDRTMTPDVADAMLAGGSAPPVVNNLAGAAAPVTPPPANALTSDPYTGLAENFPVSQAPVDFTPTPVASSPGVATVDLTAEQAPYDPYTGLAENFPTTAPPIIPPVADTGAGLGAAGVAGAGAAGAGVAGTGTAGGGLTVPPGAGLGDAGAITTPGGLDSTVAGGGGITAGTTGGAGLDTSGLALGGTLGAGAAVGTALPLGSGAAAGSALGTDAAAGLTGIPVVDDFLNYIGTPAGAAALGAFGSLAGGYLTGQAAKDAAQIQADSAANALKLQEDQFKYQKGLLEPYRARGESALNRLAGVMGLDGQPGQPQQLLDMDPGYAFRLGEGMKALERVQAARGNMLSGGAIKAGQRYAQDFASGEYGNAYNRLANIAGLGQTVGGQLGSAAQQFGQTAGETMSQGANALAAGRINRTSGYMGGIGGAVGAFQNYQNQQQQNQLFGRYLDIYGRALGVGS